MKLSNRGTHVDASLVDVDHQSADEQVASVDAPASHDALEGTFFLTGNFIFSLNVTSHFGFGTMIFNLESMSIIWFVFFFLLSI